MLLAPVYKDYIWGGTRIPRLFGREAVSGICAESWEITDRPEGMGVIENGPLGGETLGAVVRRFGAALVGTMAPPGPFPLLIKIIDAKQRLSVQVHPDDDSATRYGGEAKTEMWYVLAADENAAVFAGMEAGTAEHRLRDAITNERLERLLVRTPAVPGEAIYIPGGCLHAIGEGCLLLEVQQNSNTTYRIYDWGRAGKDGRPRDLHIEEAIQVIDWTQPPPEPCRPVPTSETDTCEIVASPYFRMTRTSLRESGRHVPLDGSTFHALFTATGACDVTAEAVTAAVPAGTSCLIPASVGGYTVAPRVDGTEILTITLS